MRFLLVMLVLLLPLLSQEISKIRFEGLVHLSDDVAKGLIGFDDGSVLDEAKLDQGIKALHKQGYFKDIWITKKGSEITIHVTEKPVISKIEVNGFEESDKDKRNEVLQLKKGQIYDEKSVEQARQRIVNALEQEGAIDSIVEVETTTMENGSVELVFQVSEGKEITITSLILHGNEGVDKDDIQSNVANSEAQSVGWLWGRRDGELKLPELKIDPLRMRDFYMQKGYLDAQVQTPLLRVDFNTYTAELSYEIKEGTEYKVDTVDVVGYDDLLEESRVKKLVTLKKGTVFNIKTFREDMTRLKDAVADLGYAYAKVNPDLQKDETTGLVAITFQIIPGEKVYIRDVIITGNERTIDRVVRRDVFLAPGDLYSATDLKDSQNALGRTGFFEKATIEQKRVGTHEMDLLVHVKETPTGNVQVGGGYGSYAGFSFDASLSDRNIFGSGINAAIQLQSSQYSKKYSFSLSNPRINDSDYSGSMNLFSQEFELIDSYISKQAGVTFSVGKRFTRTLSGSLRYSYVDAAFPEVFDTNLTAEQVQPYIKSSTSLSLSYNNTDDFYVPRAGLQLSDTIEYAGIGGNAKFVKNSVHFAKYLGFRDWIDYDMIMRYKFNLRSIEDNGFIPLDEHFYMGGLGTVRGYEQYSLPNYIDNNGTTSRSFYATKMFTQSLELSMPLVDSARLRWAVFVDYGYIGATDFGQEKRGGYGAQIEWFSPMGPIALIFANVFDSKESDRARGFEFSIGRPF